MSTPIEDCAAAVQRAEAFCRAIGCPVAAGGTAARMSVTPVASKVRHLSLVWEVHFGDAVTLRVDEGFGDVVSHGNQEHSSSRGGRSPSEEISRDRALDVAAMVLRASGDTDELVFERALLDGPSHPDLSRTWLVEWTRQFAGFPYLDQKARVQLNAETGGVMSSGRLRPTHHPASAVTAVDADRAVLAAVAQMQAAIDLQSVYSRYRGSRADTYLAEYDVGRLVGIRAVVVQPNRFWDPCATGMDERHQRLPGARVAWDCRFYHAGAEQEVAVYMDAETAAPIGGTVVGWTMMRGKPRPSRLRQALAEAREVRIYRREIGGESLGMWPPDPVAVLTGAVHAEQLELLKTRTVFWPTPVRHLPEWQLVLVGEGAPAEQEAEYYPETGALGIRQGHAGGYDWAVVERGFRDWLSEQTK